LPELEVRGRIGADRHQAICSVLPYLQAILSKAENRGREHRINVREALSAFDTAHPGRRFWGANLYYTRKHSAESAIISAYYQDVLDSVVDQV